MAETPESDRALFDRLSRQPSLVARERPSWGFAVGLGAIAVGGLILFVSLDAARTASPPVMTSATVQPAQIAVATPAPVQPMLVMPVQQAGPVDDAGAEQSLRWHLPA